MAPPETLLLVGGKEARLQNFVQQHSIRKEATEKIWLDSQRSTVQQCTDVNYSRAEAGKISQ